jgi:hypothetical protein
MAKPRISMYLELSVQAGTVALDWTAMKSDPEAIHHGRWLTLDCGPPNVREEDEDNVTCRY